MSVAEFFHDGGPAMFGVTLAGLVGTGICIAYLVKALRRRQTGLGTLAWASVAGILAVGLLGTLTGVHEAIPAIGAAAMDQRAALTSMTAAIAILPFVFSLGFASVEVFFATIAATVQANTAGRQS